MSAPAFAAPAVPESLVIVTGLSGSGKSYVNKCLEDMGDDRYALVACIEGEIVGMGGFDLFPKSPRRRHAGYVGLVVHEKWHAKGVGTALMQAHLRRYPEFNDAVITERELAVSDDNAVEATAAQWTRAQEARAMLPGATGVLAGKTRRA